MPLFQKGIKSIYLEINEKGLVLAEALLELLPLTLLISASPFPPANRRDNGDEIFSGFCRFSGRQARLSSVKLPDFRFGRQLSLELPAAAEASLELAPGFSLPPPLLQLLILYPFSFSLLIVIVLVSQTLTFSLSASRAAEISALSPPPPNCVVGDAVREKSV